MGWVYLNMQEGVRFRLSLDPSGPFTLFSPSPSRTLNSHSFDFLHPLPRKVQHHRHPISSNPKRSMNGAGWGRGYFLFFPREMGSFPSIFVWISRLLGSGDFRWGCGYMYWRQRGREMRKWDQCIELRIYVTEHLCGSDSTGPSIYVNEDLGDWASTWPNMYICDRGTIWLRNIEGGYDREWNALDHARGL